MIPVESDLNVQVFDVQGGNIISIDGRYVSINGRSPARFDKVTTRVLDAFILINSRYLVDRQTTRASNFLPCIGGCVNALTLVAQRVDALRKKCFGCGHQKFYHIYSKDPIALVYRKGTKSLVYRDEECFQVDVTCIENMLVFTLGNDQVKIGIKTPFTTINKVCYWSNYIHLAPTP